MSLFFLSILILALLGGLATLLGRVLVAMCGASWLRAPTLDNFACAAVLGTAAWLLAFGLLSHLGMAAPRAAVCLLIGCAVLLGPVAWRKRHWLTFRKPGWAGIGAALLVAVTVTLTLLPAALGDAFPPFGDQYTYVSISDWLQQHGFCEPCNFDMEQPCTLQVHQYQRDGYRMGAIFLLASVEGLAGRHYNALDVFPAVLAWGMLLCHAGIYLMCRWCLRVSWALSWLTLLLAALTFNPLYFSSYAGLLPQFYGLATLAHGVALLTRLAPRGRWHVGSALLVGLAGSGMISTYNEFAPFLGVLGGAFTIRHFLRARPHGRQMQLLRFTGLVLAALLILGNVEYWRLLKALPTQLSIVVGTHQSWSALDFWTFASGVNPIWLRLPAWLVAVACVTASVPIALGLVLLCWRRRGEPLFVTVGLLTALTVYFAFIARDPWSGERGHTWSLFKLCQWSFPMLVALQAAGWERLMRRYSRLGIGAGITLAVLVAWVFLPIHLSQARAQAVYLQQLADSRHPFRAWKELGPRLDQLGFRRFYLINDTGQGWFPGMFATYLLWPRPFVHGEATFGGQYERAPVSDLSEDTAVFIWNRLPFSRPWHELPGGFSLLDREQPAILDVSNRSSLRGRPHEQEIMLRRKPLQLLMWAPRAGRAMLTFQVDSERWNANGLLHVHWSFANETKDQQITEGKQEVRVELSLPMGLSRLSLQCTDESAMTAAERVPGPRPLTKLTDIRLHWADQTARAR